MNCEELKKQNIFNIGESVFNIELLKILVAEYVKDKSLKGIKFKTITDIYITYNSIDLRKLRSFADIITDIKLIPDIDYEYMFNGNVIKCETIPICIYCDKYSPIIKFKENYGDKFNKIKISFTGYTLNNDLRKYVSRNEFEDCYNLYSIDNIQKK